MEKGVLDNGFRDIYSPWILMDVNPVSHGVHHEQVLVVKDSSGRIDLKGIGDGPALEVGIRITRNRQ